MMYTFTVVSVRIEMKGIRIMHNRFLAFLFLLMGISSQATLSESIKVGVVQTVIEDSLEKNCNRLLNFINRANAKRCQIVIFPEGALYWPEIAVDNPTRADHDRAIAQIGRQADSDDIYVIFGVGYKTTDTGPYLNRAVAYDPKGRRLLLYKKNAEVPQRFHVHRVPFNLVLCSDRGYMEHSDLPCLIVSREGGHNKSAPNGLEYYLPYQTSIVKSAGSAEAMIIAARKTSTRNDMDLIAYWRNRNRQNRAQNGWYDWIKKGTLLIEKDTEASVSIGTGMD